MLHAHKTQNAFSTEQSRWDAVVRRNAQAAGAFVYGVRTTGVYCLPGCPSRLPSRKNVRFFGSCEQAERAGFRPCKRCRPSTAGNRGPHTGAIIEACRILAESERPPALKDVAVSVGLSPFHFHRLFKKTVGITPGQYAAGKRATRMRELLHLNATVTEALYNAGFASSSRFYEKATETLGMQPSQYRKGGQGVRIRIATAISHLGWVLVAATDRGICAIDFGESPEMLREQLRTRFPKAELRENDPEFMELVKQVLAFIESPRNGLDLPLDIQGTAFQKRVWMALRDIPAGSTVTYTDIADRIGKPNAVRAVANACGANAIAVAVPCHRVVRKDGGLAGYRWGIDRKQEILEMEKGKE